MLFLSGKSKLLQLSNMHSINTDQQINQFRLPILLLLSIMFIQCSSVQQMTDSPESSSLQKSQMELDIEYLASDELEGRATGSEGERQAARYISNRMRQLGLIPKGEKGYYQDFSVKNADNPHAMEFSDDGEMTVRNVIGYMDNKAPTTVVIGAHYDHLGYGHFGSLHVDGPAIHNGADDNASGVAGMLYLAEQLSGKYASNNYLFIGFSGEEHGLWGSNYFTKNPTIDLSTTNYMINMDMVGRLNEEGKLSINGVGTSPAWNEEMQKINVKGISTVTTEGGLGASDHSSFYVSEIPALHFFTGQHMDYHKPSDDEEKINYAGLEKVLDYIMRLIEELDDNDKIEFTETTSSDNQRQRSFKVTLGVMPDYLFDGEGMRIDGVRPDRPASLAGIEKGDVVLKMGDYDVDGMEGYMDLLEKFNPGESISVTIKRGDQILIKEVTFD